MITESAINKYFLDHSVNVNCICGNDNGWIVSKFGRYGNQIQASLCRRCGHIWAKRQLPEKDLKEFYSLYYRELYSGGKGLKNSEAYIPRIRAAEKNIYGIFSKHLNKEINALIVEWGCGAGWNLIPFKEKGYKVIGYDLDIEYTKFGKEVYHLDLHTIENYYPNPDLEVKADFLILNHVLEHVTDPKVFLKNLVNLLKPETGLFYIGLPVIESLSIWGFKNFFHVAHLHYFSGKYFIQWMKSFGFDALEINHSQGIYLFKYNEYKIEKTSQISFKLYNITIVTYYYIKYQILFTFFYKIYERSNLLQYIWRTTKSLNRKRNKNEK
jgi:2-polyprenyl-3-methyl-5-hydroxy-6-metoxy-1,4-benzoquinol methylase